MRNDPVGRIYQASETIKAATFVMDRALFRQNGEADADVQTTIAHSLEAAYRLLMDVAAELDRKEAA